MCTNTAGDGFQQGNWRDRTEWHNLVAYGRTAEIVRDYVSKSSQLFVQGKIQTRSWGDKQSGHKRYRSEIFVHELTLLGNGHGVDGTYYRGRSKGDATSRENPAPQFEQEYQDQELSPDEIAF